MGDEQLEWENYQRAAGRRLEREQGRRDATEDMSEDLSEGEKGDPAGELAPPETPRAKPPKSISDSPAWTDDNKGKKLYIVLIRSSSFLPLPSLTLCATAAAAGDHLLSTACTASSGGRTWSSAETRTPAARQAFPLLAPTALLLR